MSNSLPSVPTAPEFRGGVPRALWIGGGLLGLATAALAGALITRSIDAVPAPDAEAASAPTVMATASDKTASTARKVPAATAAASACTNCGTVESVRAVEQEGQGTGLGAVAGGVAGGLLGNQFGSGKGKTAMTLLGAVGGGLAGHQVEKKVRSETVYNVSVRMHDGSIDTFQQTQPFAVGTKVVVDGKTLRMANAAASEAK